jgi:hypothetical protein
MNKAKNSEHFNLTRIKIIHTAVWIFFNVVIWYLLYAVITNQINALVWIGVGLIIAEGIVLLIFKNMCPLTIVARKYSSSFRDNFDIYLPNWLARNNKLIYTIIFIIILCILFYRVIPA